MQRAERYEARSAGFVHYFTGKPCKRGHIAMRRVSSGVCVICADEQMRRIRAAEPDRTRETARKSMLKWREANPDIAREREQAWREANPGKVRAAKRRRREAVLMRTPVWFGEFDEFVVESAYEIAALRERATGCVWHVDHIVPLLARKASGLHCAANLQVIPERLNRRKSNKLWLSEPLDWLAHV